MVLPRVYVRVHDAAVFHLFNYNYQGIRGCSGVLVRSHLGALLQTAFSPPFNTSTTVCNLETSAVCVRPAGYGALSLGLRKEVRTTSRVRRYSGYH